MFVNLLFTCKKMDSEATHFLYNIGIGGGIGYFIHTCLEIYKLLSFYPRKDLACHNSTVHKILFDDGLIDFVRVLAVTVYYCLFY